MYRALAYVLVLLCVVSAALAVYHTGWPLPSASAADDEAKPQFDFVNGDYEVTILGASLWKTSGYGQLAVSNDGKQLALNDLGKLTVINLATQQIITRHATGADETLIDWMPKDSAIVSHTLECIRIRDVSTGKISAEYPLPYDEPCSIHCALSPDGKHLAANTLGDLDVLTFATGEWEQVWRDNPINAMQFVGNECLAVHIWLEKCILIDTDKNEVVTTFHMSGKHDGQEPVHFAASSDGQTLLVENNELRIYDLNHLDTYRGIIRPELFAPKDTAESERITSHSIACSSNGKLLYCFDSDGKLRTYDIQTGKLQHTVAAMPNRPKIQVALDDALLVALDDDATIHLVDVVTGKTVNPLPETLGGITDLDFSCDGERLICLDEKNTLSLWNAQASIAKKSNCVLLTHNDDLEFLENVFRLHRSNDPNVVLLRNYTGLKAFPLDKVNEPIDFSKLPCVEDYHEACGQDLWFTVSEDGSTALLSYPNPSGGGMKIHRVNSSTGELRSTHCIRGFDGCVLNADGSAAAFKRGTKIRRFDFAEETEARGIVVEECMPIGFVRGKDSKRLVLTDGPSFFVYDFNSGEIVLTIDTGISVREQRDVSLAMENTLALLCCNRLALYDCETGSLKAELPLLTNADNKMGIIPVELAVSSDCKTFAIANANGTIALYRPRSK